MITTQPRRDTGEMHVMMDSKDRTVSSFAGMSDRGDLRDDLYRIVSLSLLFFDAIVKPFDRMIEEGEAWLADKYELE